MAVAGKRGIMPRGDAAVGRCEGEEGKERHSDEDDHHEMSSCGQERYAHTRPSILIER